MARRPRDCAAGLPGTGRAGHRRRRRGIHLSARRPRHRVHSKGGGRRGSSEHPLSARPVQPRNGPALAGSHSGRAALLPAVVPPLHEIRDRSGERRKRGKLRPAGRKRHCGAGNHQPAVQNALTPPEGHAHRPVRAGDHQEADRAGAAAGTGPPPLLPQLPEPGAQSGRPGRQPRNHGAARRSFRLYPVPVRSDGQPAENFRGDQPRKAVHTAAAQAVRRRLFLHHRRRRGPFWISSPS